MTSWELKVKGDWHCISPYSVTVESNIKTMRNDQPQEKLLTVEKILHVSTTGCVHRTCLSLFKGLNLLNKENTL